MIFELETHKGVKFTNPIMEVYQTIDKPEKGLFITSVLIVQEPNIRVVHELPSCAYINGSWNDEDVQNHVDDYFTELNEEN